MSENIIKNWIALAQYDFETAQAMMASGRYLYVAFTCQQAIEKILKALYITERGDTPPYTHNLLRLAEALPFASGLTEQQREHLEDLNSYYLESRYTERISKLSNLLTQERAETLLKQTEELFRCLKAKL